MRHNDPCPQGHRSLRCACLGAAAHGGHCRTRSVGKQAREGRGSLRITHTTLGRVGPDRVPERGIHILMAGDLMRITGTGILG